VLTKLKPKSEFTKNVLTLMTGTTIAQAIPIAISPILTRLYTPEDFGVLSLYTSIVAIFASFVTGRFELALMIPKSRKVVYFLFIIGLSLSIFFSLLIFFFIFIFHDKFLNIINNEELSIWLYFVPLSVFLLSLFNLLNYFNSKIKLYKDISKAKVVRSFSVSIVQIILGIFHFASNGLIIGQIISQFFANSKLILNIKPLVSKINIKKLFLLILKYKHFPTIAMFSMLLGVLFQHISNILISTVFSIQVLGYYALIQRVLGVPSSLIGTSIGQVFYQNISDKKNNLFEVKKIFYNTMNKLFLIAIPIYFTIYFISPYLFGFVFGEEWIKTGEYAQILIPFIFIRFIVSPLDFLYNLYGHLHLELLWRLFVLLGTVCVFYISYLLKLDFILFLKIYSSFLVISYLISLIILLLIVNSKIKRKKI